MYDVGARFSFLFWNRRKLCNKILPSQGHQFYVSIYMDKSNINGLLCASVFVLGAVSFVAIFTNFLFCILTLFAIENSEKKGATFRTSSLMCVQCIFPTLCWQEKEYRC